MGPGERVHRAVGAQGCDQSKGSRDPRLLQASLPGGMLGNLSLWPLTCPALLKPSGMRARALTML